MDACSVHFFLSGRDVAKTVGWYADEHLQQVARPKGERGEYNGQW